MSAEQTAGINSKTTPPIEIKKYDPATVNQQVSKDADRVLCRNERVDKSRRVTREVLNFEFTV